MYLMNDPTLPGVVESNFANIESEGHSLEGFKSMLARLKDEPEYCQQDFVFDMRSGLREHYTAQGSVSAANSLIRNNPESIKSLISMKIDALKKAGFMDQLSAVMLADFCHTSGSFARGAANGHTVDLFKCCLDCIWQTSTRKDLLDSFIGDVIRLELIRDTPLNIIEQSHAPKEELKIFAKITKRRDILSLLDSEGKRDFLSDQLGM